MPEAQAWGLTAVSASERECERASPLMVQPTRICARDANAHRKLSDTHPTPGTLNLNLRLAQDVALSSRPREHRFHLL